LFEPSKHRHREDDFPILAANIEIAQDIIRDSPNRTDEPLEIAVGESAIRHVIVLILDKKSIDSLSVSSPNLSSTPTIVRQRLLCSLCCPVLAFNLSLIQTRIGIEDCRIPRGAPNPAKFARPISDSYHANKRVFL
jgi:hypothetical protein